MSVYDYCNKPYELPVVDCFCPTKMEFSYDLTHYLCNLTKYHFNIPYVS